MTTLLTKVYFKDSWNMFDFITVIGSSVEVGFTHFGRSMVEVGGMLIGYLKITSGHCGWCVVYLFVKPDQSISVVRKRFVEKPEY